MLLQIPNVLSAEQLAQCRGVLETAAWVDGKATSGPLAAKAKDNMQLPEGEPEAKKLGDMILGALERNGLFMSAALPLRVYPPGFNRYTTGQTYGLHSDNAIRQIRDSALRVRGDVSATLFLSDPADYDGGELVVNDTFGAHAVKLPAGHMVLYPAGSLHQVQPVTRGVRLASFFWIQSMVRDDGERTILLELDLAIQRLKAQGGDGQIAIKLSGIYHNLLRRWSDT